MTTKIMIINFGPKRVEILQGTSNPLRSARLLQFSNLWPSQAKEFYVYDSNQIQIKELEDVKAPTVT